MDRLWLKLDEKVHRKPWKKYVPKKVRNWVCYRFDKSIGVFNEDELDLRDGEI